jgi:hypothetical protein
MEITEQEVRDARKILMISVRYFLRRTTSRLSELQLKQDIRAYRISVNRP